MSQYGSIHGGVGAGGPDFHLPDEILAVIPTDPYDQLDLARKITSMAIASRVSKLEAETGRMKQKMYEKDRVIYELEEKVSHLQRAYQEAESRLKITLDDNMKLANERDSFAMSVKKLTRDLAKLETFKRQLMQSLNDDNLSQTETVDIVTCDQSVPKAYSDKDEGMNGFTAQNSYSGSTDTGSTTSDASRLAMQRFAITPYITPRLTPTGTPKIISSSVSPRGFSTAGSPQKTSGTTSPTRPQYDGRTVFSSWYPSSQQSSAANSPPRGRPMPARTPRIDGKEFFRQARSRLSYEQFSAFLANIKELNAQKQTREETLRKAEEIFGTDNKDLYLSFQGLLNRNIQ
ncbi:uncharacterized protein At4g15545 [Ricinus communis]|uniref:At4g15545-like C-terminal domain-containing protein n=1 Tax=Ricinus communis TaxID=3988 RepID=B9RI24_RICCO|nr:uncharacterized protein At4g15545 [Ricinus communis]EEF48796.1 conserved hypothetical protein [Ricinus communis]|eukprot:XP_002513393.1 uncharacterized protein At4g15545 [Ricinus communis]